MNRALLISTGIGCGVLCSYCPQVTIGRAYKGQVGPSSLDMATFKTCIDKLPLDVTVDFTGFYEPFLNPACTDMILYAADRGHSVRLSTTIMGLTPEQIVRFEHIPFVKFAVHLPDDIGLTRIIVDAGYMATLRRLTEGEISNIAYHVHEGTSGPQALHRDVGALLERANIEPENRWVLSRAGNIEIEGVPTPERIKGPLKLCRRVYKNVLLPNGDVALCCMDWGLTHVVGNLKTASYASLFESDVFKHVLRAHLDDTLDLQCRTCEIARPLKRA